MLRTDRNFPLDDPPEVVWQALEQVEGYQRWWPWLLRFDAEALSNGARWVARIRIPVPWSLRIELELHDVCAPTTVRASVAGDVEGTAAVTVEPAGTGSIIRVRSELGPRHRLLRAVNEAVPSVSRRMHDHVIDTAFRQFAERDQSGGRRAAR